MESLSDLNLSNSLSVSEHLICIFNLFALFLLLFICLVVKGLSSSNNISGLEGGGDKVGGGGGGLLGLGGLVRRTAGAGGGV